MAEIWQSNTAEVAEKTVLEERAESRDLNDRYEVERHASPGRASDTISGVSLPHAIILFVMALLFLTFYSASRNSYVKTEFHSLLFSFSFESMPEAEHGRTGDRRSP